MCSYHRLLVLSYYHPVLSSYHFIILSYRIISSDGLCNQMANCSIILSSYRIIASSSDYLTILSYHLYHLTIYLIIVSASYVFRIIHSYIVLPYHHLIVISHHHLALSSYHLIPSSYHTILSCCFMILSYYRIVTSTSYYLIVISLYIHIASPLLRRFSKICKKPFKNVCFVNNALNN